MKEIEDKDLLISYQGKRNTAPPRPTEKQPTLLERSSEVTSLVAQATGSKDTENKLSKHQIQKAREKAKREAKVRCGHNDACQ